MRTIILAVIFLLVALFGALHAFGLSASLYWKFWWYDILMHSLGGVVVGAVYLWAARHIVFLRLGSFSGFSHMFLFTVGVCIVWEVFEYTAGIYPTDIPEVVHQLDIAQDIFFGVLGATMAYMAISAAFSKEKHG